MIFEKADNGNVIVTESNGTKHKLSPTLNVIAHPHNQHLIVFSQNTKPHNFTAEFVVDWRQISSPSVISRNDAIEKLSEGFFFKVNSIGFRNVLYVSKNGDNSTAKPGSISHHYFSITAARNAAGTGDLIVVFPGTYTDVRLLKNNVTYFMHEGVIITGSRAIATPTEGPHVVNCNVTGYARFHSSSNVVDLGAGNDGSKIFVECVSMTSTGSTSYACVIRTDSEVRIQVREDIIGGARALDFRAGPKATIYARNIKAANAYNGNCHAIAMFDMNANGDVYVELETLSQLEGSFTEGSNMQIIGGPARLKLKILKPIEDNRPLGSILDLHSGTFELDCHFKTAHIPFIRTSWYTGYNFSFTGRGECTNGNVFNIARNGTAKINGTLIAGGHGIHNTAAGFNLILEQATIISQQESIFSTQPINVQVLRDFHYQVAPNDNVTLLTPLSRFNSPFSLAGKNYWTGTQAQYDALTPEEKEDPDTFFFITQETEPEVQ